MSKKLKLGEKMDLIEIYENGQWEEFIDKYIEYSQEIKELRDLLQYFKLEYFIDFHIYESPMFMEYCELNYFKETGEVYSIHKKECILWRDQLIYKLIDKNGKQYKVILGEDYVIKSNIFEDSKIEKLEKLSKKWLRVTNRSKSWFVGNYLSCGIDLINESERFLFAKKYLRKAIKLVSFDTSLEEAIDYGYSDVIEFLKNNKKSWSVPNLYQYLGKKLKRLRQKYELSEEELAVELNLNEFIDSMKWKLSILEFVREIENGNYIELELLIKYANYFQIKLDDIISQNSVMEALIEKEKQKLIIKKNGVIFDSLWKKYKNKKVERIEISEENSDIYIYYCLTLERKVIAKGKVYTDSDLVVKIVEDSNELESKGE